MQQHFKFFGMCSIGLAVLFPVCAIVYHKYGIKVSHSPSDGFDYVIYSVLFSLALFIAGLVFLRSSKE